MVLSICALYFIVSSFISNSNLNSVKNNDTTRNYFAGIAVNNSTDIVYVADFVEKNIQVIDGQTNKTLHVIPINGSPWAVSINPITNKIYVINRDSQIAVSVIDGSTNKIIKEIDVRDMGAQPPEMSFNPMRIQEKYYKIEPTEVAVNSNTNKIYVSDWNYPDGGITIIDGSQDKVIDKILGLGGPSYGIAVNPRTNKIYVNSFQSAIGRPYNVTVINGETDKIMTNITIGAGNGDASTNPQGLRISPIALNPTTNLVYAYYSSSVTGNDFDSIAVINGTDNRIIDKIPMSVSGIAVNSRTNMIYATISGENSAIGSFDTDVIDGKNDKIINHFKSDNIVFDVAVNPTSDNVYVTNNFPKNSISIYNSRR
jgi:YVTN family beta-propeller protein